jgi:hypothetical protein
MADTTQAYEPRRGLTFDDVWAALMELREFQRETAQQMKETDIRMKETDMRMKETAQQMKETDMRMKETDRKIGDLGNRFGELAEHLVAPSIREKFNALGYHFDDISQNREIVCPDGSSAEIDILLENGDFAVAVEVKAKLSEKDITAHIRRMEILRRHFDRHHNKCKLRGAVAGAIISASVKTDAQRSGFYVIEQTGDTVRIDIPEGFIPREW